MKEDIKSLIGPGVFIEGGEGTGVIKPGTTPTAIEEQQV